MLTCSAAAENFNWCTVPEVGYDVIFVPGIAVILACLLQNRLSTTWVLVIGAPIHALIYTHIHMYEHVLTVETQALDARRPDSKAGPKRLETWSGHASVATPDSPDFT